MKEKRVAKEISDLYLNRWTAFCNVHTKMHAWQPTPYLIA